MNFVQLYRLHDYFKHLMSSCLSRALGGDIDYCRAKLFELRGAIFFCFYNTAWDEFRVVIECYQRFSDAICHLALKMKCVG